MKSIPKELTENSTPNICPHLALRGDTDSYAAFPSSINACFRGSHPVTPMIAHQRFFCLTQNHIDCPFYKNKEERKFPKDIQYKTAGLSRKQKGLLLIGISGFLIVMVFLFFIFGEGWQNLQKNFVPTQTQNAVSIPTEVGQRFLFTDTPQIEEAIGTEVTPGSFESSPTAILLIPSPTNIDPVLALDTPIGGEYQFIIHRVLEGESLQYYADLYKTSVEAILDVNEDIVLPLWVGSMVVIPINTVDVANFPSFFPHQIREEGTTIGALADELVVPIEEMTFYNNIDSEHILHEGEWLLIPRN